MGILNVTPDSFSDGGAYLDPEHAVARARVMAREGAEVIDVGGQSTRPGAHEVSLEDEACRVLPVIQRLARAIPIPISIDTSKADIAARAVEAGASIVNDVTALRGDPDMAKVVARTKAAVILMHMQGTPETMQRAPRYREVVGEVSAFLLEAAARADTAGIHRSRILIDPGLGFGKTLAHNLALLRACSRLVDLGFPVVLGPSRKSFIGAILGAEVNDRLAGTLACVALAQRYGVHMVRVHDVKPAVHLLRMLNAIEGQPGSRRPEVGSWK